MGKAAGGGNDTREADGKGRAGVSGTGGNSERKRKQGRRIGFGVRSHGSSCLHESQTLKGGEAKFYHKMDRSREGEAEFYLKHRHPSTTIYMYSNKY